MEALIIIIIIMSTPHKKDMHTPLYIYIQSCGDICQGKKDLFNPLLKLYLRMKGWGGLKKGRKESKGKEIVGPSLV